MVGGGGALVGVGVGPAGEVEATDVGVRHAARPRLLHPGRGQAQLAGLLTLLLSEGGLLWSLLLLLLLLDADQLPPVLLQHSQLLLPRLEVSLSGGLGALLVNELLGGGGGLHSPHLFHKSSPSILDCEPALIVVVGVG